MQLRSPFGSLSQCTLLRRTSLLVWCHSQRLRHRAFLGCAWVALAMTGASTAMAQDAAPVDVPVDPAVVDVATLDSVPPDWSAWSGFGDPNAVGPDGQPLVHHFDQPFFRNFTGTDGDPLLGDGELNPLIYYAFGGMPRAALLPAAHTRNQIAVATVMAAAKKELRVSVRPIRKMRCPRYMGLRV